MSVLVLCKFTPLGFETLGQLSIGYKVLRVNLPRWGLKLMKKILSAFAILCKFTPLGFETSKP